jgi:1,4-dihydroxy-2-naphthoyl-CoA hydrolase
VADDTATDFIRASMPMCATLGITATQVDADRVVLAVDWRPDLCTTAGLLHGGVLMALADSAGAACAFVNLPDGAVGTSTIESKTNFLGAVRSGTVVAVATPLHVGRSTIVVETELRAGAAPTDRLVGKTTQTQTVLYG